jgi:prepilin-type N-terminal cleavage/methylation domain-containing protein
MYQFRLRKSRLCVQGLYPLQECFKVMVMLSSLNATGVWRNMKQPLMYKLRTNGFTLVELMIALSVLSTILVIASVLMFGIGKLYIKGVNQATIQTAARDVMSDVASTIQFSSDTPQIVSTPVTLGSITGVYVNCIGKVRYTFVLNRELGHDNSNDQDTPHVLWRDTLQNAGSCQAAKIDQAQPATGDS